MFQGMKGGFFGKKNQEKKKSDDIKTDKNMEAPEDVVMSDVESFIEENSSVDLENNDVDMDEVREVVDLTNDNNEAIPLEKPRPKCVVVVDQANSGTNLKALCEEANLVSRESWQSNKLFAKHDGLRTMAIYELPATVKQAKQMCKEYDIESVVVLVREDTPINEVLEYFNEMQILTKIFVAPSIRETSDSLQFVLANPELEMLEVR